MDKRKRQIAIDALSNSLEIARIDLKSNDLVKEGKTANSVSNTVTIILNYLPGKNQIEIAEKILE